MSYSPPTKGTLILSFLILLIGIVIGIWEIYDGLSKILGVPSNYILLAGFILTFLSWIIVYIGVRVRGL
ncbi:MAG: hypothetical protein EU535_01275 [Promethearchaeota archaeon]|nr:MAG: hypothetical protein EU535_01275 [Candidatus Lokiarchaeota archaeon]